MEFLRWCRLQWDRVLGVLGMALGVVLLLLGWIEVSATEFVAEQVPYVISAGLGGIVALLIGATLWLSADLRDEWRALDRIDERLVAGDEAIDELLARIDELEARSEALLANGQRGAASPRARRQAAKRA